MLLAAAPRPVVVELFTSEGCSSCPPADEALRSLDGTSAEEGVEIISLGFHVDYWNRLGWKDPFSESSFSARQEGYARFFQTDDVYTPQFLVNGRVVRTSGPALRAAFRDALSAQSAAVSATVAEGGNVKISVPKLQRAGTVYVAVTEKNLSSKVTAGENSGRTLALAPVVRKLLRVGSVDVRGGTFETRVELGRGWDAANTSIVAFVQDEELKIVGATRVPFSPMTSARK